VEKEYIAYNFTGQPTRWENNRYNEPPVLSRTNTYFRNVDYNNARIFFENGYAYGYYFFIRDHLGSIRAVINNTRETITQSTEYYPFGMPYSESTGQNNQPFEYNGKEFETMNGLNQYDYGFRHYDPVLGRFLTPDPLAEKYPWISQYAYCGNNPVNRIDPTGMIWEKASLEEVKELKESLDNEKKRLDELMKNYQDMINSGTMSDADVKTYTDEILAFTDMIPNIETTVSNIDRLGTDKKHIYSLQSNQDTKIGYVSKGKNDVINIVGDGMELTVHEITHVRQSLDAGKLTFDSRTNKLGYAKPGVENQANYEVEAYQKQFSITRKNYFDSGLGQTLRSPNQITPQMVGNLKRPGTNKLMYPAIHRKYPLSK
jgi:RHS repeat-associated protein